MCQLAYSFDGDGQLDAAEETALQMIDCFLGKGEQFEICQCYRLLGKIWCSKGKTEKAIDHLELALEIASSLNWHLQLLWIYYDLAELSFDEGRFDDAHIHIELAKSHAVHDPYRLGRVVEQQAWFWYRQGKFEEAKSTASHAADVYGRFGATKDVEDCRDLLQMIEEATKKEV